MGVEEKETWGVRARTDPDLECHGLTWHRVVGEYLRLDENIRRPVQGIRETKSGRWGVDRWRGQRVNLRESRGRDSEESGGEHKGMRTCERTNRTESVDVVMDMRAASRRRTYKTII
jgi:hypothetical protein